MSLRRHLYREDFRFELRAYEPKAAPALHEAAVESREGVAPWMAWLHDGYSPAEAAAWTVHAVAAFDERREFEFLIYDRHDEVLAGAAGLNQLRSKDHVCNLGYWVRTSKARMGAATQAVLLLKDFGLRDLGQNRLEIVVAEGNEASRRVAERAGAFYEGVQKRRIQVGRKIHDAHMYALVGQAERGVPE